MIIQTKSRIHHRCVYERNSQKSKRCQATTGERSALDTSSIPSPLKAWSVAKPEQFHKANRWVYFFCQLQQCQHLMPIKNKCIYCGSNNKIKFHRYDSMPARDFDRIVQVVHLRVSCSRCNKDWALLFIQRPWPHYQMMSRRIFHLFFPPLMGLEYLCICS